MNRRPASNGRRAWPGMTSVYAALPPHAHETVTGAGQVGVAFSPHRDVTYSSHGRRRTTSYPGGSVVCSGDEPIVWSDVRDHTEALEIYPDPGLLRSLGVDAGELAWPVERTLVGHRDPVVLGVATALRTAHVADHDLDEVTASTLAHLLARHVLQEYGGRRVDHPTRHARLSRKARHAVADLVEDDLAGPLTLGRLAAEAHLSPFHFARAFTATVGTSPHRFVTARRIDRARTLLTTSSLPVEQVAAAVGYVNVPHFRRVFRAQTGLNPAEFRAGVA